MNYLGHIYLSGSNKKLMVGNFIADSVKGKQYLAYPLGIQEGILLHRKIDDFTDRNPHWMEIQSTLKPIYKRYAGVVADMVVDHFLAANWDHFSDIQLSCYTKWIHAVLLQNYGNLPPKIQSIIPILIKNKRLQSYSKIEGIACSLNIMSQQTSLPNNTKKAITYLKANYSDQKRHSLLFLNEIKNYFRPQKVTLQSINHSFPYLPLHKGNQG